MTMPYFDRLHSIDIVDGDRLRVRALTPDDMQFDFSISRDLASILVALLMGSSKGLTPSATNRPINNIDIQLVMGPDEAPALALNLSPELRVVFGLQATQLTRLRESIEQFLVRTTPANRPA